MPLRLMYLLRGGVYFPIRFFSPGLGGVKSHLSGILTLKPRLTLSSKNLPALGAWPDAEGAKEAQAISARAIRRVGGVMRLVVIGGWRAGG